MEDIKLNQRDKDQLLEDSDVNLSALGQAIDTTWGRSSTPNTPNFSVKITIAPGPRLVVSYAAIVNFGNEQTMILMKRRYQTESQSVIEAYLKHVKKTYKDIEGTSISLKELTTSDSIELTSTAVFTARKQAYFRRKSVYEVK